MKVVLDKKEEKENNAHQRLSHRRMMGLSQFISEVDPVSHLAQERMGYRHHSIVLNVEPTGVDIIHYGSTYYLSGKVEETFLEFDKMDFEKGIYLIRSNGYPQSMKEKNEAISRALSRLGEEKYMLANNNCEHFATWVLTGTPLSHQIMNITSLTMAFVDTVDAVSNKKSKISTFLYNLSFILPAEEIGGAVVGPKYIRSLWENVAVADEALETVGKSVLLKRSLYHSVSFGAVGAAFEIGTLAMDLYDLNESRNAGIISERDYNRGFYTRMSGAAGSFAGSTAGNIIGQLVIPWSIYGRFAGSAFFSVSASAAASVLSGLAFDNGFFDMMGNYNVSSHIL